MLLVDINAGVSLDIRIHLICRIVNPGFNYVNETDISELNRGLFKCLKFAFYIHGDFSFSCYMMNVFRLQSGYVHRDPPPCCKKPRYSDVTSRKLLISIKGRDSLLPFPFLRPGRADANN